MTGEFLSAFSVLLVMLGFFGLVAWAIKRFGLLPGQPRIASKEKKLKILDNQMLDTRNRLVVVRWGKEDYLLGTGAEGVRIIDKRPADTPESFGETLMQAGKDASGKP